MARGEAMVPPVAAATRTAHVEAAGLGAHLEAAVREAAVALGAARAHPEARVHRAVLVPQVAGEATAAVEAVAAAAAE